MVIFRNQIVVQYFTDIGDYPTPFCEIRIIIYTYKSLTKDELKLFYLLALREVRKIEYIFQSLRSARLSGGFYTEIDVSQVGQEINIKMEDDEVVDEIFRFIVSINKISEMITESKFAEINRFKNKIRSDIKKYIGKPFRYVVFYKDDISLGINQVVFASLFLKVYDKRIIVEFNEADISKIEDLVFSRREEGFTVKAPISFKGFLSKAKFKDLERIEDALL